MTTQDLSSDFSSFAASCRYEDLPGDAIDIAKRSILDLLGVSLAAGGVVPAIARIMELMDETGGKPECSILGFPQRAPALMAAFANGAMAHCLDFDDQGADGHHPSSSLIPAVLAAAERKGGVSGRRLITAVALGQDLFLRMRRNIAQRQDWHMTTVLGVFSATAGVCHVLGLDAKQTANALGIASLGSCGTLELRYGTESELAQLYAGFVAKSAMLSALLAQKGVTGTQSVFEGRAGVFNTYFAGQYDRAAMVAGLGRTFAGGTLQYKPWPTCGLSHTYIHATLELLRQHGLAASDIAEIRPHVGDFQQQMCYPLEARRRPATPMDARFSLPFALACAVVHGRVGVQHFTDHALRDAAVLDVAARVVPVDDSALDWRAEMPIARVDIVTRAGIVLTGRGEGTPGSREQPMGWPQLARKFDECAALAAHPPSAHAVAEVQRRVMCLQDVDDASDIVRALTGHA